MEWQDAPTVAGFYWLRRLEKVLKSGEPLHKKSWEELPEEAFQWVTRLEIVNFTGSAFGYDGRLQCVTKINEIESVPTDDLSGEGLVDCGKSDAWNTSPEWLGPIPVPENMAGKESVNNAT